MEVSRDFWKSGNFTGNGVCLAKKSGYSMGVWAFFFASPPFWEKSGHFFVFRSVLVKKLLFSSSGERRRKQEIARNENNFLITSAARLQAAGQVMEAKEISAGLETHAGNSPFQGWRKPLV